MLLKSADDKSKRLALLEDLQKSTVVDATQRKWLREHLWRLRAGIRGEVESAFYLDQHFKKTQNFVLLHDLRFEFEGDVAQIDHLAINRLGFVFLIETKNYSGDVDINPHGEFTVTYDNESYGVPSPIEQSRRHARILKDLMERLEIKNRTGSPLDCHHVVLFHPKAVIRRPPPKDFDTSNVIKADQFPTWHEKWADKEVGVTEILKGFANVRSIDTVKEWAEKLIRQHRPANQLKLPDSLQPKSQPAIAPIQTLPTQPSTRVAASSVLAAKPQSAIDTAPQEKKRLICLHCNSKISFPEGRFCWNNEARFKGGQYCREHQALF